MSDTQHGWVVPLAGGFKADCGGPSVCGVCMAQAASILARLIGGSQKPVEAPVAAPAPTPAAPVQAPPASLQQPAKAIPVQGAAVELVTEFEGFSAKPYRDPVGVWTIGYGSTRDFSGQPVTASTSPVTKDQAKALVARDLTAAAVAVNGNVQVAITPNEAAAMQDFIYNLGVGNFKASTLLRKLNAGDYAGASAEFDKWDMAGGKHLAGLLRRRQAETDLFNKPI
jgi:lysozyme